MKSKKITLILALILIPVFCILAEGPGGPGSGPNGNGTPVGNGGTPVGGSSPVGSGFVIMMLYAGAYGIKKVFNLRKNKKDNC